MTGAVVFRVEKILFHLPATIAMRVVPVPRIGRVPGGPTDLLGLALVDNAMVPVVSVGSSRTAMLVVSFLGELVGIVGADVLATGRFPTKHDHIVYGDEQARLFDVSAVIARLRETRWAV